MRRVCYSAAMSANRAIDAVSARLLLLGDPTDPRVLGARHAPPDGITFVGPFARVADAPPHALDVDGVLAWWCARDALDPVLAAAPELRWVHSASAGLDRLVSPALADFARTRGVVTNARGVFSDSLAEWTLAALLHFAKDLGRLERDRLARAWSPFEPRALRGTTMGIYGYGDLGQACARLARACGMRVVAHRRHPERSARDPLVESFLASPIELAAQSDHFVVALPLTGATHHAVDARVLAALPPHAVLVNIGRGPTIDEAALVDALARGRLRGAALDVFEHEPLSPESPLYALPNVLLSPHCADREPGWLDASMARFLTLASRFATGAPFDPSELVDPAAGY